MEHTGSLVFKSFTANLLRVRKIEAQIAQEALFSREGMRAAWIAENFSLQAEPNASSSMTRMGMTTF